MTLCLLCLMIVFDLFCLMTLCSIVKSSIIEAIMISNVRLVMNTFTEVIFSAINRLDRVTSGLMILAKTSKTASDLSQKMRSQSLRKTYLAYVNV